MAVVPKKPLSRFRKLIQQKLGNCFCVGWYQPMALGLLLMETHPKHSPNKHALVLSKLQFNFGHASTLKEYLIIQQNTLDDESIVLHLQDSENLRGNAEMRRKEDPNIQQKPDHEAIMQHFWNHLTNSHSQDKLLYSSGSSN